MPNTFIKDLFKRNTQCFSGFPDKRAVEDFTDQLFTFLFLPNDITHKCEEQLQKQFAALQSTFSNLLQSVIKNETTANDITIKYFATIPKIYDQLLADAEALLQFDPAAKSLQEVMAAYPGFYATAVYRFSNALLAHRVPVLPRLISEYAHSKTGIDIHPGATIGHPFMIDHGTGIVIGETSIIGNNVKIYQGVTLGALSVAKELAKTKRHPTIQDNVVIYAGTTILGGETVVGHDSIIGGNVWLTTSVPSGSVVYHKSEIGVKDLMPFTEPVLNFVI